jgi:hypothetical protein
MPLWLLSIKFVLGTSDSPIFYSAEGAKGVTLGSGRTALIGLQSTAYLGTDISGMTPVKYF